MKLSLLRAVLLAGAAVTRVLVASPTPEATVTFFGDGTLKSSTVYVDGLREGPSKQFYPDGAPRSQGSYAGGEREGEWIFWLEDGSVDAERSGRYVDGVLRD